MALEPGARRLSVSPSSSGRASPVPRRWSQRGEGRTFCGSRAPVHADIWWADERPSKDKAFRRFASSVQRSLSLFDNALEDWADYISFLGRLLKALHTHPPQSTTIPYKASIAKRLAQCLNPELPSGVHQKALEVYSYIFFLTGKDVLSRDLPLYLPGLSSTLSFASLSVRSPFLELLETYFLKLDPSALRPALKAIILALLPGLEEETSEDFERTLKLVDDFKTATRSEAKDEARPPSSGDEYFWQCFFLASITSNSRRLGALAYLVRNLPRLGGVDKQRPGTSTKNGGNSDEVKEFTSQAATMVTSPEPGLLLRSFAAGLADEQMLIQRGFLDLLVTHLPLHAKVLQDRVKAEDLELLMSSALGVVTRRDMSLNRRLWSWLLGPDPVPGADGTESPTSSTDPLNSSLSSRTRYFEDYGQKPLARAILKMINRGHQTPHERARPFRICLSLMDRWEIGGLVVQEIFLPVIRSTKEYESQAGSKEDFREVLRSANVFFDGVESGLIWGEIIALIAETLRSDKNVDGDQADKLALVRFIIAHFNVREEEMLVVHAPLTALTVAIMLQDFDAAQQNALSSSRDLSQRNILDSAVNIAMDLMDLIPERAYIPRPSKSQSASQATQDELLNIENDKALDQIRTFYVQDQGNLDVAPPPFSAVEVSQLLVREVAKITSKSLKGSMSSADIAAKTRLLVTLLAKSPMINSIDMVGLLSSMHSTLSSVRQPPFSDFSSVINLVIILSQRNHISSKDISGLIDPVVRVAWSYLSPSHPKYHVEAARGLWSLQMSLSMTNHEIEACLCDLITEAHVPGTFLRQDADPARRFNILWTHILQESGGFGRPGSRSSIVESKNAFSAGASEIMLSRPLLLLLDALLDEKTQLSIAVRTWLQTLAGIDRLLYIFVSKFACFTFLQSPFAKEAEGSGKSSETYYTEDDDLDQCLYYLQALSNVLKWSPDSTWAILAEKKIPIDKGRGSLWVITGEDGEISLQQFFVHVCLCAVSRRDASQEPLLEIRTCQLHRTALSVMQQFLLSPYSAPLSKLNLEDKLVELLRVSLAGSDPSIQVSLLDVIFAALKLKATMSTPVRPKSPIVPKRLPSQDTSQGSNLSVTIDRSENGAVSTPQTPPPTLIKCLQEGFEAPSSRPVLDSWVNFLSECLPLYSETIFQVLIPLIETLCAQVERTFDSLKLTFQDSARSGSEPAPESTLISFLNGLEQVLARGHARLLKTESRAPSIKSPDHPQGFFGTMVSGVFSSDAPQSRSLTANDRLTVLLSFQDAIRISFKIWSWGGLGAESSSQDMDSAASFNYTSLRMRNRARRLLEHLFAAEPLECLETVIEIWQRALINIEDNKHTAVFNLLHVLDGSRPKHTIPAIFDAIYSRTNPAALEPSRKSTLTSTLLDTDLVVFLVEYARSLDDDAMDEIWTDCMSFLKDILTNPLPHRQILPSLLEFAAILGEKVDNTNFGEQRRMRKELGDLFLRLLTATFTTKPIGYSESTNQSVPQEKALFIDDPPFQPQLNRSEDVIGILASITPSLPKVLVEPERILIAANTISTSVIGPTFRSKTFPDNVTKSVLVLLYQITRLPNTQKSWKKDVGDAFNDARFFSNPTRFLESDWLPLLRQWSLSDKDRMPELLSRLTPPTTAGIVFGVGATSARLEADRKTQLNLRRIATLILAATDDTFVTELQSFEEKLVELLSATTTSSPSSITRAEIFMVLRALVLKISPVHLSLLWPTISIELYTSISSVIAPDHTQTSDTYNNFSILQACKLLDILLCIAPDDFQLHEWLFITDTVDAVYRPPNYHAVGLIDELAEELGSASLISSPLQEHQSIISPTTGLHDRGTRRPLLGPGGINCYDVNLERKDELIGRVLRPFFAQLSIFSFERTYEMGAVDWEACRRSLMIDLFDERGVVKAL
ncbi:MAG: hypothetical protein M1818_005939 [Claussenomyces sp. TS43310]|nr:MAG: hypothetical protein M1818_005939 [Claussenomyces sp. TS43310]